MGLLVTTHTVTPGIYKKLMKPIEVAFSFDIKLHILGSLILGWKIFTVVTVAPNPTPSQLVTMVATLQAYAYVLIHTHT